MAILIGLTVLLGAGWFIWQRQRAMLSDLRLQLSVAQQKVDEFTAEALTREMAELDRKAEHEDELEAQTKRFDKAYDALELKRAVLEVECNMHKLYAYVCRDCKQPDLNVQTARDRNLRSVTSGPKR